MPLIALAFSAVLFGAAAEPGAPVPAGSPAPLVPPPPVFTPVIDDPLLAPAPRAAHQVDDWDQAITQLRRASTDDASAAAAVDRAEGRWRQSLSLLLPNARAFGTLESDRLHPSDPAFPAVPPPGAPTASAGVSGSLAIVDLPAWEGLAAASASNRSAREIHADVQRRLTQGLARSLVAVVTAERVAELNRLGLRQALERAALTTRTRDLGAATDVDVVRVEQDVEVARVTLIAGDEQLRRVRESLSVLLGWDTETGVAPGFTLDGLLKDAQEGCKPVGWEARPDLLASKADVDAARHSRRSATAGYLPRLSVTTDAFGYEKDAGGFESSSWNVAAVLSMPIWEGGAREGIRKERRGIEKQAKAALESDRREISQEVARARRGVNVASELSTATRKARDLAEKLDALTRRSFEVGRGTSLELVQSAAALRQAEVSLAARELDLVNSRIDAFLVEARCEW